MGMLNDVKAAWNAASQAKPVKSNKPRDLTEADRLGWYDAGDEREKSIKPRTVQDVQSLIRNRNPVRWRQLQGHYKWLQKEMKRIGLNPEDARYIL